MNNTEPFRCPCPWRGAVSCSRSLQGIGCETSPLLLFPPHLPTTTHNFRRALKTATVWGRAEGREEGALNKGFFKLSHANISKKLYQRPSFPSKNQCILIHTRYLSAAPFLRGVETHLTKQVSLAWRQTRQLLPEITGSSFSKAVLFSGNQCISTKINSFSVRRGRTPHGSSVSVHLYPNLDVLNKSMNLSVCQCLFT